MVEFSSRTERFRTGVDFAFLVSGVWWVLTWTAQIKNGISGTLSLVEVSSRTEIFRTGVDFAFSVSGVVGFDPGGKEEAFLLSVANSNSSVAAPPSCLQCGC